MITLDLVAALKSRYLVAYAKDDRKSMDLAARAISYATSGSRELAREIAKQLRIKGSLA